MKLTAQVAKKFYGEVSTYKVGETVEVTRIYDDECTIQDECGYRCVVGVPLRFLDFSDLARALATGRLALSEKADG